MRHERLGMKKIKEANGLAAWIWAQRRLTGLSRYGSHKVKVAVRRVGSLPPREALAAVRDARTLPLGRSPEGVAR